LIFAPDLLDNDSGGFRPERIQLEQAVTSLVETRGNFAVGGASLVDESAQLFAGLYRAHAIAEALEKLASTPRLVLKRVQALVMPERQHFLKAAADKRNVDMDSRRLPDAVEAPDALLEQLRIKRKIVQGKVVRELEVSSFAPDFRA
jgi:hypothetical protein